MEQAKWTEDLAFDESELDEPQQRPPHHRSEWRSSEEDEDPVRVQVIPKLINLSGNRATAYRITDVAPIQKKRLEEEDEIILAAPTWTEDIKFGDIDNDEVGLAALKVETPRNRVLLEDHPLDEDFWLNEDIPLGGDAETFAKSHKHRKVLEHNNVMISKAEFTSELLFDESELDGYLPPALKMRIDAAGDPYSIAISAESADRGETRARSTLNSSPSTFPRNRRSATIAASRFI